MIDGNNPFQGHLWGISKQLSLKIKLTVVLVSGTFITLFHSWETKVELISGSVKDTPNIRAAEKIA